MKKSTLAFNNSFLYIVFLFVSISLHAQDDKTINPTTLNNTELVNVLEDSKLDNVVISKVRENIVSEENLNSNAVQDSKTTITNELIKPELFVLKSRDEKATLTKKSVFFKFKVKYYWC